MFKWLYKFFNPPRPQNTGVLLGNQPTDYFAGVNSPIEYKERIKDGNWLPYTWSKNRQWCIKYGQYVDQMSCVTHSQLTAIEAQEFFLTGKQVKYSRRWIAKLSDTTPQGNYLYKVADTIRKYGLVLESDYPTPETYTWNEFYAEIPPAANKELLLKKGQDWLSRWTFQYEFLVPTDLNLDHHLKHSPIQIVYPNHAVVGIYSPTQLMKYRDSYEPYDKDVDTRSLVAALKPILTPRKLEAGFVKWNNHPEVWFMAKMDSMQRLERFKNDIAIFDPDYAVREDIITLPTNKPF